MPIDRARYLTLVHAVSLRLGKPMSAVTVDDLLRAVA